MKLVDVECSFEGNKILFFFTADGRVDFRELVKDLAVEIRLNNVDKREAIKKVLGFDVTKAIEVLDQEKAEAAMTTKQPTERRVKIEEPKAETTGRRTDGSKYKVVTPKE